MAKNKEKEVVVPKKKRRLTSVKKREPVSNDPNEAMLHVIKVFIIFDKKKYP